MDEAAYRQLLRNTRRYEAFRLSQGRYGPDSPSAIAKVIREAAAALRNREQAQAVWNRVAPARLRGLTRVEGWENGELLIRAANPAVRFELSRCTGDLLPRIAACLPGVRRIRIEVY